MSASLRMTARVLRSGLPGLVALLLGIAFFEFVQPLVIASFGGASGLDAIMSRIPPALQVFVRARPEFLAMSGLAGYLSLGFTHPLYIVLAGAAIVGFAARSLAGEMDRGIVQIPLSRPVSRQSVYLSRALGGAIVCIVLALSGPAGMIAGMLYARPDGELAFQNFAAVAIAGFSLFFAFGGITLCGSAAANTAGRVVGWSLGILMLSYFIDYFAGVWTLLESITFLSLFNYYDPTRALVTGHVDEGNTLFLITVGVVTAALGLVIFTRRDLPT